MSLRDRHCRFRIYFIDFGLLIVLLTVLNTGFSNRLFAISTVKSESKFYTNDRPIKTNTQIILATSDSDCRCCDKILIQRSLKKGRSSPSSYPKYFIRPESAHEAFKHIWKLIEKIPFFSKHNYNVTLPNIKEFQKYNKSSLIPKQSDMRELKNLFMTQVYRKKDYDAGIYALKGLGEVLKEVFLVFDCLQKHWEFKVYPTYPIQLTLYGTGGHYVPKTGKVLLLTTPEGKFKRSNGISTIIHEMVHLGIEASIVKRYALTHPEKETVVNLIMKHTLSNIIPNYRFYPVRAPQLASFVNRKTICSLPEAIESYIKAKSR